MQDGNNAWMWSEAFAEVLASLIREPLAERAARPDWPKQRDRLSQWLQQLEAARRQHQHGYPETLRVLYDHWQNIAGDDPQHRERPPQE
jgi:hypothetical protein